MLAIIFFLPQNIPIPVLVQRSIPVGVAQEYLDLGIVSFRRRYRRIYCHIKRIERYGNTSLQPSRSEIYCKNKQTMQ